MTYKVGAKGQVVLPKELRERHGIAPGDEVVFADGDGEIVVRKARARSKAEILRELKGSLADGPSLTDALMEEKRLERERHVRTHGWY